MQLAHGGGVASDLAVVILWLMPAARRRASLQVENGSSLNFVSRGPPRSRTSHREQAAEPCMGSANMFGPHHREFDPMICEARVARPSRPIAPCSAPQPVESGLAGPTLVAQQVSNGDAVATPHHHMSLSHAAACGMHSQWGRGTGMLLWPTRLKA
jgi:hypothetical protein